MLLGNVQKVSWAKMCQNAAPPKCIFITWLLFHERLATCGYLLRIGIHVDQICCLCGMEEEKIDHLFFDCEMVRKVWKGVTEWCRVNMPAVKWEMEKDFLISQCRTNCGKQRLYRCMVTVLTYHV